MRTGLGVAALAAFTLIMAFAAPPALADDDASVAAVASTETPGEMSSELPPQEIALVVFGGGSTDDMLKANGCTSGRPASLWTYSDGGVVFYSEAADAEARAPWESLFSGGIPAFTPLGIDCR